MTDSSYTVRQLGSTANESVSDNQPAKEPNNSLKNDILLFWHCAKCSDQVPPELSLREYANIEVGLTPDGIQVWCKRHEVNVACFSIAELANEVLRVRERREELEAEGKDAEDVDEDETEDDGPPVFLHREMAKENADSTFWRSHFVHHIDGDTLNLTRVNLYVGEGPSGEGGLAGCNPGDKQDVGDAQFELYEKVWYARTQQILAKIDAGTMKPLPKGTLGKLMAQAERIEKTYGKENLWPLSDLQHAYLLGKFSAINWLEGDEWDYLDT